MFNIFQLVLNSVIFYDAWKMTGAEKKHKVIEMVKAKVNEDLDYNAYEREGYDRTVDAILEGLIDLSKHPAMLQINKKIKKRFYTCFG